MFQPPGNALAIVVDMRNATSNSVYIQDGNNEYLDMVGLDFKGHIVIVPWQQGLKFITYGECNIAVVCEAQDMVAT